MLNCIKGKQHLYYQAKEELAPLCTYCGLLKSTIEQDTPAEKIEWRDNLHKTIKQAIYGKQDIGLAQVIIDAIDAAYVQGLEDGRTTIAEAERRRDGELKKKIEGMKREQGIYYDEKTCKQWPECCELCHDCTFEHTYPAHTAYYACLDLKCECHNKLTTSATAE